MFSGAPRTPSGFRVRAGALRPAWCRRYRRARPRRPFLTSSAVAPSHSAVSSSSESDASRSEAITTRSRPSMLGLWVRNTSRKSRFARFRAMAFPTFLEATTPSRVGPSSRFETRIKKERARMRASGARWMRTKSARARTREARGNDEPEDPDEVLGDTLSAHSESASQRLLLVDGRCETRSALAATSVDDFASALGGHPRAEAVLAKAAGVVGLERALHLTISPLLRFTEGPRRLQHGPGHVKAPLPEAVERGFRKGTSDAGL